MKIITNMELQHIIDTLERCVEELDAASDDGYIVDESTTQWIQEAIGIVVPLLEGEEYVAAENPDMGYRNGV